MTEQTTRPALTFTFPIAFSAEERIQFKKAIELAGFDQEACPTCGIDYMEEGEASALSVIKDHGNRLEQAHKVSTALHCISPWDKIATTS